MEKRNNRKSEGEGEREGESGTEKSGRERGRERGREPNREERERESEGEGESEGEWTHTQRARGRIMELSCVTQSKGTIHNPPAAKQLSAVFTALPLSQARVLRALCVFVCVCVCV